MLASEDKTSQKTQNDLHAIEGKLKPFLIANIFRDYLSLFKNRKYYKAIQIYNQVIKLDAGHAKTYWRRGMIYSEQGKYEPSEADY